jgi:hypothetical protein
VKHVDVRFHYVWEIRDEGSVDKLTKMVLGVKFRLTPYPSSC